MVHAFLPYAAASLIPVLLLGVALALGYRAQARANGIARAQSQAHLLAQTAIEPILDGTPLGVALPSQEQMNLQRVVGQAVTAGSILRLRLRNLDGTVVYSDDGSGFSELPDDEALDAAHGQVIARLTRLGTDANDRGQPGVPAVEVYQPLTAGTRRRSGSASSSSTCPTSRSRRTSQRDSARRTTTWPSDSLRSTSPCWSSRRR